MEGIHIEVAELDVPEGRSADARALLSQKEQTRAGRFIREEDRLRFVAARAFLRRTLARRLGTSPEKVVFAYGSHGKPELAAPWSDSGLRFNLSHSAGRAVLAWTERRELGVDLEKIRPVRFGVKIAHRFFTDHERRAFDGLEGAAWNETFFRCWTRKEAFIKAVGDGLSYPLKSFSVPMPAEIADAPVRVHADASARWVASSVDVGPGFLAALVIER